MQRYKYIFTFGFAIFAMFFGSGNLVFPIRIGLESGNSYLYGFLGLFLTGIILPFLGLFVIKLHNGNYKTFFGQAGTVAGKFLPFFILSLLGSFAVIPRCITVAHGGLNYLYPEISLFSFSLVFCVTTLILCLKDKIMVKVLGKWMSPMLLIILLGLIFVGIIHSSPSLTKITPKEAFQKGFMIGYQTMDLFAAFFFSALTFTQIQHLIPKNATDIEILKFVIKPSILGALLLTIVYLGFVYLGANYGFLLEGVAPESFLPIIAIHLLGDVSTYFIAIAMILSCITTAVALNNIYARYLFEILKIKDNHFYLILILTTTIAFIFSLLDFKGIAKLLVPVLEVTYPGLIALTIVSLFSKNGKKFKIFTFYIVTIFMVVKLLY